MADSFLYDAFISYRHGGRDQEIAELLHRWLENYRTPAEVVRKGALPRLTRVFRDQDELQTSSDLSESITAALKQSRFLIVICSPRAKDSPWINQEIERFRNLGGGERILPLLIDGKPETAFPESLYVKERVGHHDTEGNEVWTERVVEPLAANICAPDLQGAKRLLKIELLRLLSPILGCGFDDLRGRHQERARRRLAAIAASMAALTLVFAGLAVYAFLQRNEAVTATGEAVAARLQAEKNEQRAEENEKRAVAETDRAEEALLQRSIQESNRVAALANEFADRGKTRLPMALALQVAPRDGAKNSRPLTPSINALLNRLVRTDRAVSSAQIGENLFAVAATKDEKWVFTGSTAGNVQFWKMPGLVFQGSVKAQEREVTSLHVSPDQKSLLVSGTATPSVWDIESGTKRLDIKLPVGFSRTAQYTADGKFIIASSNRNRLFVISAADGSIVKTIDGPLFSDAYEKALARGAKYGVFRDGISTVVAEGSFNMFGAMSDFAISPDGGIVAAAGDADPESAVRLYSLPDGKFLRTLSGNQFKTMGGSMAYGQRLLFSPDGSKLFAIAEGEIRSQIQAFDVATGRLASTFIVPTVGANTLASDINGNILLTGHKDGSIVLWCIADGRFVNAFRTHTGEVSSLVPSRDGSVFISASNDGSAAIWAMPDAKQVCAVKNDGVADSQIAAIKPLALLDGHTLLVHNTLILDAAHEVVTVSRDGSVRLWRLGERGLTRLQGEPPGDDVVSYSGYKAPPLAFFDHDRKLLVSPNDSEQSSTWDLATRQTIARPDGSQAADVPQWFEFFKNRGFVEMPDGDQPKLQLIDMKTRGTIAELAIGDKRLYLPQVTEDGSKVFGLAVSPDDYYSSRAKGPLAVWDAASGQLLAQTAEFEDVDKRLLASRDGLVLVALQHMPTVPFQLYKPLLFVAEEGKLRQFGITLPSDLANGEGAISAAALSSDGKVFSAATAQGTLYAWNVENGQLIGSFQAGSDLIDKIVLSNAADTLAASDITGRIFLYNITEKHGSDLPASIISTGSTVQSLGFSADGRSLAALLSDHSVRVIAVDPLRFQKPDDFSLLDWVTAHHFGGVNPEDRTKYGIVAAPAAERSDRLLLAEKSPMPAAQVHLGASVAECDKLASDPYDGNRRAPAVEAGDMAPDEAEAACAKALTDHPEDATTIYQAGRSLLRKDKLADAMKILRRAADKNYPAAMSRLALNLYLNPELPRDSLGNPDDLMRQAAAAGDLLGTLWVSAEKARNGDAAAISATIRSAMTTGHVDAAAAALLAARGIEKFRQKEADNAELALIYYQLGVILSQSMPSENQGTEQHLANAYGRIRTIAQDMSPDRMVAIYRTARGWRMSAVPD